MRTELSLDLETGASVPGAAILTVGIAASDGGTFYRVVDDPHGIWEPRTIRWHTQQTHPALNVGDVSEAFPLHEAMTQLGQWLMGYGADKEGRIRLWGHGAFDVPILAAGFYRAGLPVPWHYRAPRDLRTLYDLAGGRPDLKHLVTVEHHALSDALYQLEEVRACLARIPGEDPS